MTPRKLDNIQLKKWTALPPEFRQKAAQVFSENFPKESESGSFLIDGRIYPTEILLRAGYIETGRLRQANFEVSIETSLKEAAMEKLFLGVDVLGSVFETHFEHLSEEEEDDVEYPVSWEEFEFDDAKVFLRFSTENTKLESEADHLLGIAEELLFNEGSTANELSYDALDHATSDNELAHNVSQAIRDGRWKPTTQDPV